MPRGRSAAAGMILRFPPQPRHLVSASSVVLSSTHRPPTHPPAAHPPMPGFPAPSLLLSPPHLAGGTEEFEFGGVESEPAS